MNKLILNPIVFPLKKDECEKGDLIKISGVLMMANSDYTGDTVHPHQFLLTSDLRIKVDDTYAYDMSLVSGMRDDIEIMVCVDEEEAKRCNDKRLHIGRGCSFIEAAYPAILNVQQITQEALQLYLDCHGKCEVSCQVDGGLNVVKDASGLFIELEITGEKAASKETILTDSIRKLHKMKKNDTLPTPTLVFGEKNPADVMLSDSTLEQIRAVFKLNGTDKAIDMRNAAIHGAKIAAMLSQTTTSQPLSGWDDKDMLNMISEGYIHAQVDADKGTNTHANKILEEYKKTHTTPHSEHKTNGKIVVEFLNPMEAENYDDSFLATITHDGGSYTCASGVTKEAAFDNLMGLMKLKIAHDNGIMLIEPLTECDEEMRTEKIRKILERNVPEVAVSLINDLIKAASAPSKETLTVKMEHFPKQVGQPVEVPEWYASIPQLKGVGESGASKEDAFRELMISLAVKIAYDSKLEMGKEAFVLSVPKEEMAMKQVDWEQVKNEYIARWSDETTIPNEYNTFMWFKERLSY